MIKRVLTLSASAALATFISTASAVVDEDFMQTVEDTHKSLTSNLAVQNAESATTDAKLLEGYFAEIEDHFVKKGDAQDGVDLSKKSRELVGEVMKTVSSNDFTTASQQSAEIGRACKACHKIYNND